jgi:hypothetical protein
MIHISFGLSNPWGRPFANLWNRAGDTPFKHKHWEVELLQTRQLIGFEFRFTTRQSHAGLNLELALFGYSVSLQIYDNRHWNHEEGRWMIYNEEQGMH